MKAEPRARVFQASTALSEFCHVTLAVPLVYGDRMADTQDDHVTIDRGCVLRLGFGVHEWSPWLPYWRRHLRWGRPTKSFNNRKISRKCRWRPAPRNGPVESATAWIRGRMTEPI